MQNRYEGIVISTVDYKESSKIINVFTKDSGIIGIMAKGSKRLNNKLSAVSNTLDYGYFYTTLKNERVLPNLIEGEIINNYKVIKKDIVKLNYSLYLMELATQVYKHQADARIYELLINSINKINEGYNPRIITSILELQLLDFLGIRPIIDMCVVCNEKTDIVTISSYKGGYVCKKCVHNDKIYNTKTVKLLRMFYYVDIKKITKLDISENIQDEIQEFINDYYDRYAGLYLKSKTFLEEFMKLNG